jgi:hypothetical protein
MLNRFLAKLGWPLSGMLVPDDHPDARAFIQHMQAEALPVIAARTVVLYGATDRGLPYVLGTGVPLRCGGRHFVVTAAHVFDEIKKQEAAVYLRPGSDGGPLTPIDPLRIIRSEMPASGVRMADQIDLCLIELPDEIVSSPGARITYAELEDIDPYDDASPGSYYFLHGFPRENLRINRCRRTVSCKSLPYGTITYDGSRGEYSQLEDVHLDLDFHPRKAADQTGRRIRLPDPRGISGCGIWRLSRAGVRIADWTINHVKLVAIEHRYNDDLHVLRGTQIKYVNTIIHDKFPQLRALMRAAWPA